MRVTILATGQTEEHNESYGARLIEQMRAVLAPAEPQKATGRRGTRVRAPQATEAEPSESGSASERTSSGESERSM